jgi:hypothetical protein
MPFILILFGPSVLSLALLASGVSLARTKNAHRSWGVLAGAVILLQGFFLVAVLLFLGTKGDSLLAPLLGSPLGAGFALWLGSLVARIAYLRRERRLFPK